MLTRHSIQRMVRGACERVLNRGIGTCIIMIHRQRETGLELIQSRDLEQAQPWRADCFPQYRQHEKNHQRQAPRTVFNRRFSHDITPSWAKAPQISKKGPSPQIKGSAALQLASSVPPPEPPPSLPSPASSPSPREAAKGGKLRGEKNRHRNPEILRALLGCMERASFWLGRSFLLGRSVSVLAYYAPVYQYVEYRYWGTAPALGRSVPVLAYFAPV